jgi:hypothetical protein
VTYTRGASPGPGLWLRIRHRFGPRLTEWVVAVQATLWGVVLLLPADTFTSSSWSFFVEHNITEGKLGTLMLFFGMLRLAGLVINGALRKVTPVIRVASASVGFFVWTGISYSFAQSGVISTWIAIYPVIAVVELVNIARAARDVGESYGPA